MNEPKIIEKGFQPTKRTTIIKNNDNSYEIYNNSNLCLGELEFQTGEIKDGINGITNEDLLRVLLDRLETFQQSKFKCRENAIAITNIEQALLILEYRTKNRILRGVEGTHTS